MSLEHQMNVLNSVTNGVNDKNNEALLFDEVLERSIIASLLNGRFKYYQISDEITESDFTVFEYNKIFKVCKYLSENNIAGTPHDVDQALKKYNDQSKITLLFLETLASEDKDKTFEIKNSIEYLKLYSSRRKIKSILEKAQEKLKKGEDSVSLMQDTVNALSNINDSKNELYNLYDKVEEIPDLIDKRFDHKDTFIIKTGIKEFDDMVRLKRSNLVVVGAKTGSGKTTFCLNIARNMALNGVKVYFISTEMDSEEVNDKIMAISSGVELDKITGGLINTREEIYKKDVQAIGEAMMQFENSRFIVEIGTGMTYEDIKMRCKQLKETGGLDVVIIDYIQRLKLPGKQGRYDETTELSNRLKDMALELNLCVFEISQFSRDGMKNSTKNQRPTITSFKESGSIENDANVALLLYRESTDDKIKDKDRHQQSNEVELIVAKNRMGATGNVGLFMHLPNNRMWGKYDHEQWTSTHVDKINDTIKELTI